jgi:CRP-like cAMP-binding protein
MITADELRRFTMFKHMDTIDLQALAQVMRRTPIAKNTVLFRKGEAGESMMLIMAGQVRIFMNDDQGNEITFRTLGAGQILGEFSLLDRKNRSASAATTAPLDMLILQRADFLRLLHERPLVGIELMRSFAERIRYATSYLERLYDALELLSNSEYDEAIREMALSSDEDEMRELITTFLTLAHRVQEHSINKLPPASESAGAGEGTPK